MPIRELSAAEPIIGFSESAPPSSDEIAEYARSRGLSENHVRGLLANIQAESSFRPGIEVNDAGKMAGGLFQHRAERLEGLKAAVPNWQTNWRGQIDYALSEPEGRKYISQGFASPSDAARWFTINFERPANMEQKAQERAAIAQGAQGGGDVSMRKFATAPTKIRELSASEAIIPAQPKERPGLFQDIGDKMREGIEQVRTGKGDEGKFFADLLMKAGALFTNTKPMEGPEILSNLYNRGLGLAKAIYSPSAGVARQYVGRPLEEAGHTRTAAVAEAGADLLLGLAGGGVGKIPGLIQAGKAVGGVPGVGMRVAGRILDPLAVTGVTAEEKVGKFLGARDEKVKEAQTALSAAQENLGNKELQEYLVKRFKPAEAVSPQLKFPEKIVPEGDVGSKILAGEKFQKVIGEQTSRLFKQSSENYGQVLKQYGDVPVTGEQVQKVRGAIEGLEGELRGNRATNIIGENLTEPERIAAASISKWIEMKGDAAWRAIPADALELLAKQSHTGPNLFNEIIADSLQKASGGAGTMGQFIRLRQIAREYSRQAANAGNLSARNAAKQVEFALGDAIGPITNQADIFHRHVHELVGPDSLAQKIFGMEPEQVIDAVFMPTTGKQPAVTMINRAKEIYQGTNPEAWQDLMGAGVQKFQQRVIHPDTGVIDPQKYHRTWQAYKENFKAGLPDLQYQALDILDKNVAKFNVDTRTFNQAANAMKAYEETLRKAEGAVGKAQKPVSKAEEQLLSAQTFGMGKMQQEKGMMNVWNLVGLAQFGQAAAALATGNIMGFFMQNVQGVMWLTVGNPVYLSKVANNPKIANGIVTLDRVIRTGKYTVRDIKAVKSMADASRPGPDDAEY